MGFCANFLILLSCRMDTGVSETFTGRYVTTAARPGTLLQSHDGYRRQRVSPYTGAARRSAGRPSQQCRTRPDGSAGLAPPTGAAGRQAWADPAGRFGTGVNWWGLHPNLPPNSGFSSDFGHFILKIIIK